MEEHLRNFATAYEENYGKPFTVYGINMDEYLQQFWNDRAQEKLCAKNARVSWYTYKFSSTLFFTQMNNLHF